MAEFFNRKEEVIFFEFTTYGKQLFAEGKFRPEYYSFHDGDIVYDPQYTGVTTEVQNAIKDRIKETPRIKFTVPKMVETNINAARNDESMTSLDLGILGRSNFDALYPRYGVTFLGAKSGNRIKTFVDTYDDTSGSVVNIPQVGVGYDITVDGEAITENDPLTLFVREYNANSGDENYEIEFFEKEENGTYVKIDPSELGIEVTVDAAIPNYEEHRHNTEPDKGGDESRVYWVKNLQEVASKARQERDDIYVIDDPGEVCD